MRLLTNSATFGLISNASVSFDGANVDKATAKPPNPQPTSRNATFAPLFASRVGYSLEAMRADRFLVLPHPELLEMYRHKGADYDRWIAGMRRYQRTLRNG